MTVAALKSIATPLPPHIAAYEPFDQDEDDPIFEQLHIENMHDWPDFDKMPWRFDTCKIEQSSFMGIGASAMHIWDSIMVRCDLSANKFFESGLLRSEFLGCRCTGLQLGESSIKDISFQNCKLNMVSFRKSKLERVVFENCILDDADFNGAKLTDVVFRKCQMNRTDFSASQSIRVDMTQTEVNALRGVKSLKNVRISAEQMLEIAPLLCVDIGITVVD